MDDGPAIIEIEYTCTTIKWNLIVANKINK